MISGLTERGLRAENLNRSKSSKYLLALTVPPAFVQRCISSTCVIDIISNCYSGATNMHTRLLPIQIKICRPYLLARGCLAADTRRIVPRAAAAKGSLPVLTTVNRGDIARSVYDTDCNMRAYRAKIETRDPQVSEYLDSTP